ncbi:uncharacterized protein KY384_002499 [Bacidia gigantensis]|uniref:uncharacterized protein n=1 Tax=Bacidia gigantensis TaxID=2732470 RepID=UPI001D046B50|nr:uncharacterized protein KY384_002499 [Bacidia gigantensis]KAG8532622.1 hypothetical protein KY384_002499 [Bacidia gigantensis]
MALRNKDQHRLDADAVTVVSRHYGDISEVPWDVQKYYEQRYSLFSKYDDGIWMTDDGWFGVTPEPIANSASSGTFSPERNVLIDCFAGVGGNTIAFARTHRWLRIHAIEADPTTLECAKHNAQIYGVSERISWYQGDCFEILKDAFPEQMDDCVIFASPPWGGPGYRFESVFDLSAMQPYHLSQLMACFQSVTDNIVIYLPRTSDIRQLAAIARFSSKVVVTHYCIEGASKAICAFFAK